MKKIALLLMVIGSLLVTSCKKEKKETKDVVKEITTEVEKTEEKAKEVEEVAKEEVEASKDAVTTMVESALEGISIPNFSNAAVTENLKAYAAYAKEYIAAKGNLVKISGMSSKGAALLLKGKELLGSLNEDEAKKYKSVLSAIQSKMAPSK